MRQPDLYEVLRGMFRAEMLSDAQVGKITRHCFTGVLEGAPKFFDWNGAFVPYRHTSEAYKAHCLEFVGATGL
jgi:hypothetical protein